MGRCKFKCDGVSIFKAWFRLAQTRACCLIFLICWMLLCGMGVYLGPKLLMTTSTENDPPTGTPSHQAAIVFRREFPVKSHESVVMVYITHSQAYRDRLVTNNATERLCHMIRSEFGTKPAVKQIDDFYKHKETLPLVAMNFLSPNATAAILTMTCDARKGLEPIFDLARQLRQRIGQITKMPFFAEEHQIALLEGQVVIVYDCQMDNMQNLALMDAIVIPLALLVLAFFLRSLTLMVIPIVSVVMSILVSFGLMYPIAIYFKVAVFAPSVMMVLGIALSIDYSLFLLTRYREELLVNHRTNREAVREMLLQAGQTVSVSGATLLLTFVALLLFPLQTFSTIGVAGCISIAVSMLASLTLTPALLLLFPWFFRRFLSCKRCGRACCPCGRHAEITARSVAGSPPGVADDQKTRAVLPSKPEDPDAPVASPASASLDAAEVPNESAMCPQELHVRELQQTQQRSFWFKTALVTTKKCWALTIIIGILAVSVPIGVQIKDMRISYDLRMALPHGSQSAEALSLIARDFYPGMISPFSLIVTANASAFPQSDHAVLQPEYWDILQSLCKQVASASGIPEESIVSIAYAKGVPVDLSMAKHYLDPSTTGMLAETYRYGFYRQVNKNMTSTFITIMTPFLPFDLKSKPFIERVRKLLNGHFRTLPVTKAKQFEFHLDGVSCRMVDGMKMTFETFPILIAITCGVIFFLLMVGFRSLFVPFRLIFTLAVTLLTTYGMAVLVFQKGIFDWLFPALRAFHRMFWMGPVMVFPVLCGLSLDYDIFLFSRVREYRRQGFTDRASIIKGVYKTGSIITAAGVIMAIAFSGLMIGGIAVMSHMGFMLCFSVLIDAFVVRTLLVPSLLALAGRLNWWPGRMPRGAKDEMVMHEQSAVEEDREEGEAAPGPTGAPPPYSPVAADETEMKEFLAHRTRRSTLCGSFCEPGALGPCDDHKDPEPSAPPPLAPDEVTPLVHGGAPAEEDEDRPRPALEAGPAGPMRTGIQ